MKEKENSFPFILLVLMIGISVILSWWRFLYQEGYTLYANVDCNPFTESCFVYEDPECEGPDCSWNYKVVFAPTPLVSECLPDDGECLLDACEQNDLCEVLLCSEESRTYLETEDSCSF